MKDRLKQVGRTNVGQLIIDFALGVTGIVTVLAGSFLLMGLVG